MSCLVDDWSGYFGFYQEHIPVVSVMCNPGIRARHWKAMSDIIGFDITPDSGSTLRKVLKFNLKPHMDEFEGISGGASKVMKLLMLIIP